MNRVSLFGYGGTTKALAKIIKNVVFYDDKVTKPFTDENGFKVKPSNEFNPKYSSLEITSPGIPPHNPLIQKAAHLISEYDYFADVMPFSIWISGTNGKTTTTQMLQHLLREYGSVEGGNIGTPLAQLDQKAPIWVLETSSFTLHYTKKAKPNIYVLLPLSPDHLSWHGDMQSYIDDKLKPVKMMKDGEVAIIPKIYEEHLSCSADVIFYEDENELAELFNIEPKKINFKGVFLLDALLALCVKKILFNKTDYEGINSFVIDPHRQEELQDSKGRLWVNDTKATNLDATIGALKRYKDKNIRLILGGDDKGVDLTQLFEYMKGLNVEVYAIGSNEEKLLQLSKDHGIAALGCKILDNAVAEIAKVLKSGEITLLSPAAASLDQFTSYAERGNRFKELVKTL
ncbi:UDP-N-acetylmuramoyl-L-alanine--D-glutamate ligase [Sulfurimonas sp. HSL-1716]|uniref:UDP-N-acetylmuramoyl-L-alanine--D-glutamate ligase n=1 Tax=Hydrocurvibacter sulfurireducens TaxID=3131937 RepID=UPI0031F99456